jgi:hypothetical protein
MRYRSAESRPVGSRVQPDQRLRSIRLTSASSFIKFRTSLIQQKKKKAKKKIKIALAQNLTTNLKENHNITY